MHQHKEEHRYDWQDHTNNHKAAFHLVDLGDFIKTVIYYGQFISILSLSINKNEKYCGILQDNEVDLSATRCYEWLV